MMPPLNCPACGSKLMESGDTTYCPACSTSIEKALLPAEDSPGRSAEEEGPRFQKGSAIGNYRIEDKIGQGGTAEVYLATELPYDRKVALKVIPQHLLDSEAWKRFRQEAETLALLNHPGIVKMFYSGSAEAIYYIAMELVPGQNLAQKCKGEPMDPRQAAALLCEVALAVAHAHSKGVIHRDLKPSNILLDETGKPKVADFGLARRLNVSAGLTLTGAVLGTHGYMSPEQARGDTKRADERTDVYGLGATLYFLLSGRAPFKGGSLEEILRKTREQEPRSPRQDNNSIPRGLEAICLKCLKKEPARRYQTSAALADDLTCFLEGKPVKAKPTNVFIRTLKLAERKPGWAACIAVTILAVACGFGALLRHNHELKQQVWKSLLSEAQAHLSSKNREQALDAIRTAAGIRKNAVIRKQAIETITEPGITFIDRVDFSYAFQMIFSPDNRFLAIAGHNTVWTTNRSSFATALPRAAVDANVPSVIGHQSEMVRIWDIYRRKTINSTPYAFSSGSIAWSPKGNVLAVPRSNSIVALWDSVNNKDRLQVQATGACLFSPDGAYLAVTKSNDTRVFDSGTGEPKAHRITGLAARFLDRSSLLVQEADRIVVWDVSAGTQRPLAIGKAQLLRLSKNHRAIVLQEDGTNDLRRVIRLLQLPSCKSVADLPPVSGPEIITALDSDGNLVSMEEPRQQVRARIWNAKTKQFDADLREDILRKSRLQTPLTLGNAYLWPDIRSSLPWQEHSSTCAFSSDGNYFTAESQDPDGDSTVSVWSLPAGEKFRTLPSSEMPTWSNDGHFLAVRGGIKSRTFSTPLKIWEVYSGVPRYQVSKPIRHLVFIRGGTFLQVNECTYEVKTSLGRVHAIEREVPTGVQFRYMDYKRGWELIENAPEAGLRSMFPIVKQVKFSTIFQRSALISYMASLDGGRVALFFWDLGEYEHVVPSSSFSDIIQKNTEVQIWDTDLVRLVSKWSVDDKTLTIGGGSCASAFSSDGKRFASVVFFRGKIEIRETESGRVLRTQDLAPVFETKTERTVKAVPATNMVVAIDPRKTVTGVTFSHDGKLLVFAQGINVILADAATGRIMRICEGHRGVVRSLAVSSDDRVLATGGEDRLIHLWDLPSGRALASWEAYSSDASALAFSPDGRILASGSSYGTVKLWDLLYIRAQLKKLGLDW